MLANATAWPTLSTTCFGRRRLSRLRSGNRRSITSGQTFISTSRFRVKAHRTDPRGHEGLVIDASVNNIDTLVKERNLSRAFQPNTTKDTKILTC